MISVTRYPPDKMWTTLVQRPTADSSQLENAVNNIIKQVMQHGDRAVYQYTRQFDGISLENMRVSHAEITQANIDDALSTAIRTAYRNIMQFHASQLIKEPIIETTQGVKCWRKSVAIDNVGLYIPGGTAPLFSTVLMLGIPAHLAGCQEVTLCSPPNKQGLIAPSILYTASLLGIRKIYKVGGAQAIAAMAYGTKSIKKVNKIFGPGNRFVTKAKELVQKSGIAIDMPAGPSELLVIADETSVPKFIAADLLSQAEHGTDSQVVLLSNSEHVVEKVNIELTKQLTLLPRRVIAEKALCNSFSVIFHSLEECTAFSNAYAPEHLIIATSKNHFLSQKITNAGSVFIGNYACESVGDYASGTNHTLPTNAHARTYSGVSVDSFSKRITFQELTADGIRNIGQTVEVMAEAEQLHGHKQAVRVRLDQLKNG